MRRWVLAGQGAPSGGRWHRGSRRGERTARPSNRGVRHLPGARPAPPGRDVSALADRRPQLSPRRGLERADGGDEPAHQEGQASRLLLHQLRTTVGSECCTLRTRMRDSQSRINARPLPPFGHVLPRNDASNRPLTRPVSQTILPAEEGISGGLATPESRQAAGLGVVVSPRLDLACQQKGRSAHVSGGGLHMGPVRPAVRSHHGQSVDRPGLQTTPSSTRSLRVATQGGRIGNQR